jgi:hypothetical protein
MDAEIGRQDGRVDRRVASRLNTLTLLCAVVGGWCLGAAPATQPEARVRVLIDQLAHRDHSRRQDALHELLQLRPEDLGTLRRAAAQVKPQLPGQLALLRLVVRHIYISGASYPIEPNNHPFLGLSWDPRYSSEWGELGGVPVMGRIPGFAAYQALREGDLLQGVEELPGLQFRTTDDVGKAIVSAFQAGQTITLRVHRDGKVIRVRVLLRHRPLRMSEANGLDAWLEEQTQAADKYWDNSFGQVLEEHAV